MVNDISKERDPTPPFGDKGGLQPAQITLPKGDGAVSGIGEKFGANPVTGTGSMSVPITTLPGSAGFGLQLALSYDSGTGNGPFGMGWGLSLPAIMRSTDKGLPKHRDVGESDVFILSGAEDLVPVYKKNPDGSWAQDQYGNLIYDEESRDGCLVKRYRPRIEGLSARIERWTRLSDGDTHWRSISKDNILTVYGSTSESRIVDFSQVNERNRVRSPNHYLKYIRYGNRQPLLTDPTQPSFRQTHVPTLDFSGAGWMFEVVFDYGDARSKRVRPLSVDYKYASGPINKRRPDPLDPPAIADGVPGWNLELALKLDPTRGQSFVRSKCL